ncbi:MAG: Lpg1974 family pore-forming outer membrane protein [Desulfomonilaceae bacterium]
MGPWATYPSGSMGNANRQLFAQNIYQPTTDRTFSVSVPNLTPGFGIHAGFLFLQPSADNLGYAVLTNVKNPASPDPVASPFWTIQTLTPSYQPGLELGGGYAFSNSGKDFQVNWQHLRTTTSNSVIAKQGEQWVSPFSQTGPSTADSWEHFGTDQGVNLLRSAEGQVEFAYDAVNLDVGQYVNVGSSMQVRMFAGLSYARLQEQIVSSFFGAPGNSVPLFISLNNVSSYSGVGPRFDLDTTYEIPRGLRLTGQLAGALLIGGKQPSQYLFTATSPELAAVGIQVNHEHIGSDNFTQVVYSFDTKMGIGFNGPRYNLEAGCMAAFYIDPFSGYETNNNVLALQLGPLSTASMRHTLSNFTVNGLYFTGGFKWCSSWPQFSLPW